MQRWHAESGLPVHHFGGGKGPVFSYSDELDAWLSGFSEGRIAEAEGADDALAARKRRSLELASEAGELWELRSDENLSVIAGLHRAAIDLDPGNATAFAGLANALILASLTGILHSSWAYPRAAEALHRAAHLGADSAERRCASAWMLLLQMRNWRAARAEFEEILRCQPRSSFAMTGRALLHVVEGNLSEASRGLNEAWKENTFASASNALLCWVQYLAGKYDQAVEMISQARTGGDSSALAATVEALALIQTSPLAPALKRIESMAAANSANLVLRGALGYAYALAGRPGHAQEILQGLMKLQCEPWYPLALVHMGLNDNTDALTCLEQSLAEGSLWSLGLRFDPIFHPLASDHRYSSLLRRLDWPG